MILLGSKSPRRQELLAGLGIQYEIVNISCNETYPPQLRGGDIPLYIAKEKADAYKHKLKKGDILITADTIVWIDNQMLGKPHDEEDAFRMLRLLSGNTHQVYTAVCITSLQEKTFQETTFVDKTDVTFREMTDDEIWEYIHRCHPLDKAGAYGVQEWLGYAVCTKINGSFYNVMGLPTEPLYANLKKYLKQ